MDAGVAGGAKGDKQFLPVKAGQGGDERVSGSRPASLPHSIYTGRRRAPEPDPGCRRSSGANGRGRGNISAEAGDRRNRLAAGAKQDFLRGL